MRRLATLALAAALAFTGVFAAPAASAQESPRQAVTLRTPAQASTSPETSATQGRYAQREARDRDLEGFTGGRRLAGLGIVGVVLVVLLILLLI
jgi:hypothetical protein